MWCNEKKWKPIWQCARPPLPSPESVTESNESRTGLDSKGTEIGWLYKCTWNLRLILLCWPHFQLKRNWSLNNILDSRAPETVWTSFCFVFLLSWRVWYILSLPLQPHNLCPRALLYLPVPAADPAGFILFLAEWCRSISWVTPITPIIWTDSGPKWWHFKLHAGFFYLKRAINRVYTVWDHLHIAEILTVCGGGDSCWALHELESWNCVFEAEDNGEECENDRVRGRLVCWKM